MATYTPLNADAPAVGQQTITRLATVTGISWLQNPIDLDTGIGGQIAAIADAYLTCFGDQEVTSPIVQSTGGSYSGTSPADAPFPSWTWTAPVSKTYVVHLNVTAYFSALTTEGIAKFGMFVGGSDIETDAWFIHGPNINQHLRCVYHYPVAFTAGSPATIKVKWKTDATTTVAANAVNFAQLSVTG